MLTLVRRWAVDWLASHDSDVCTEIMREDYVLSIGAIDLYGREAYVDGTMGQIGLFPGLCLTVHDVMANEEFSAVRFTEHGAATHKNGRSAAWGGISLLHTDGTQLIRTWAEEDYISRSRQLADGVPDLVEPPMIAPWDQPVSAPDPAAEQVVRAWIDEGLPASDSVLFNDQWLHPGDDSSISGLDIEVLFSAGSGVAFHGRHQTEDGFAMGVAGLISVRSDGTLSGRVVTDRLGARTDLKRRQKATTS